MFVSWVRHHGRSTGIASALGMDAHFLPESISRRPTPIKYVLAAFWTVRLLRKEDYRALILMLPPTPLLLIGRFFKKRGTHLVADLHTGFFSDPKWSWATGFSLWCMRRSTAVVTNSELARRVEEAGVPTVVLHDILSEATSRKEERNEIDTSSYILCPLSYANDEPVEAILEACALVPEQQFIFTGKAPESVRKNAGKNVSFPGFVDDEEYRVLMRGAVAVLAMTTRDLTMQRAGYEALMVGKPQVTADFKVLREFLGPAAHYVNPTDSEQIAQAVRNIVADLDREEDKVRTVLEQRMHEQRSGIDSLRNRLQYRSVPA